MSSCGLKDRHTVQVGVATRVVDTKQQDHCKLQTRSLWLSCAPLPLPLLVRVSGLTGPALQATSRGQHEVIAD